MRKKNKVCPFCKSKISTVNHLTKCNPSINEDDAFILMIKSTYGISAKDVVNEYENGMSLPDIKKVYGISYNYTEKILNIFDSSTRTIKEANSLDSRQEKYKETCIKKYGVDNVSKTEEIKEKKKKTFIENYGVDNIFKTDGFAEYVSQICLKKYGVKRVSNPKKVSEARLNFSEEKWKKIHSKTRKTLQEKYENGEHTDKYISSLELIVSEVFDRNGIEYESQKFIDGLAYDFHIKNTNIIVEVNGDYWHANPKIYEADETINYVNVGYIPVSDIWDRDLEKKNNALDFGYKVLYIWECDINNNMDNIDEFILSELLK